MSLNFELYSFKRPLMKPLFLLKIYSKNIFSIYRICDTRDRPSGQALTLKSIMQHTQDAENENLISFKSDLTDYLKNRSKLKIVTQKYVTKVQ